MRLKHNAPTWEEVRERIIKAIEEEKRTKSQIVILTASSGNHPTGYYGSVANDGTVGC